MGPALKRIEMVQLLGGQFYISGWKTIFLMIQHTFIQSAHKTH
jgi:hypothetical protein